MKILVVGANGFIAREIIARVHSQGHEIIACVHNTLLENIPHSKAFKTDFTKATTVEYWLPHLKEIDVVINCVGVFQTLTKKTMRQIHYDAPAALFTACEKLQVKKIIHISALGIDKVNVPYATTKLDIEKFITNLKIDSTIIRPGLVYGKGSYGGTSLFRGLAGLPFVIPLPGKATELQQPVLIDDLTTIVEKSLTSSGKELLCVVGSEKLSAKELLIKLRNWLGFKKAWTITIPLIFLKIGAKIGNFIPNSPMSETGIKMMAVDNVASKDEEVLLQQSVGFMPRGFTDGLNGMVSSVQDRWHAQLYFLRPLLRISIAFVWFISGIVSLLPNNAEFNYALLSQTGISYSLQPLILYFFSSLDILLGAATLFNYRLKLIGTMQIFLILFYTTVTTFKLSFYWLHPFAPIAKNIPIMVSILIMMALSSER